MLGRGFFSRRTCAAPVNCGVRRNSRRAVYSGTGGRGTITRDAVTYSQEPVAATTESHQFSQYDSSPIESGINVSEYAENPKSLEMNVVDVGPTYQEQEINPISIEQQIAQPMYSLATTAQSYENTLPITNSSVGQAYEDHNATQIYPVMTKSQLVYDQEYQNAVPKTMSANSWSVPSQPSRRIETDDYWNSVPIKQTYGRSSAVSMEPRGFSVDELIPTQHSQDINFHDSSAISFDASITQPMKLHEPQVLSWNTNVGSNSLNDQWTSQQGYQQSSHMADAFTNAVTTNSGFSQGHHANVQQSNAFSGSGSNDMVSGVDMAADAAMLAQKAGG